MLNTSPPISQRLVRKGALIEETYNLFKNWKDEMSFDQNFDLTFHGSFRSEAWKKEIHSTLRRRFRNLKTAKSLIVLARGGYDISDWKYCLHFYIAIHETLYRLFLTTWLYPDHRGRCHTDEMARKDTDDLAGYVRASLLVPSPAFVINSITALK